MTNEQKKVDAVFEGGGVKGIALVGAVTVTEAKGYVFENVAGTSAGAIVACLLAAGYKASELKIILNELNYTRFKDKSLVDNIPFLGPLLSLGFEKGIYEGKFFEDWLRSLLQAKNVQTFGDLVMQDYKDNPQYRYKLQVTASDISRGRLMKLPHDIAKYGIDPDKLDVAKAVRMSISIPFFFEPVTLKDVNAASSYIVDGGLLSNFPVSLFDNGTANPPWPTLGYRLVDPTIEGKSNLINGPLTLLAALFSTMMQAHDARYIEEKNFVRTIAIPTFGVGVTDFELSQENKNKLYHSGVEAAEKFFQTWDFEEYKQNYRQAEPPSRRERLHGSLST